MVRFKNRYALCELIFPDRTDPPKIDSTRIYYTLRNELLLAHGDFGLGALQFSLNVRYLNVKTNIVVIRGERKYFDLLASTIVFIKKFGIHNVIMKTLHVGGSIRSCQKFLIGYHRRRMTQIYPECQTEEQKAKVMQSIIEACDELETPRSKLKSASQAVPSSALHALQDDIAES